MTSNGLIAFQSSDQLTAWPASSDAVLHLGVGGFGLC